MASKARIRRGLKQIIDWLGGVYEHCNEGDSIIPGKDFIEEAITDLGDGDYNKGYQRFSMMMQAIKNHGCDTPLGKAVVTGDLARDSDFLNAYNEMQPGDIMNLETFHLDRFRTNNRYVNPTDWGTRMDDFIQRPDVQKGMELEMTELRASVPPEAKDEEGEEEDEDEDDDSIEDDEDEEAEIKEADPDQIRKNILQMWYDFLNNPNGITKVKIDQLTELYGRYNARSSTDKMNLDKDFNTLTAFDQNSEDGRRFLSAVDRDFGTNNLFSKLLRSDRRRAQGEALGKKFGEILVSAPVPPPPSRSPQSSPLSGDLLRRARLSTGDLPRPAPEQQRQQREFKQKLEEAQKQEEVVNKLCGQYIRATGLVSMETGEVHAHRTNFGATAQALVKSYQETLGFNSPPQTDRDTQFMTLSTQFLAACATGNTTQIREALAALDKHAGVKYNDPRFSTPRANFQTYLVARTGMETPDTGLDAVLQRHRKALQEIQERIIKASGLTLQEFAAVFDPIGNSFHAELVKMWTGASEADKKKMLDHTDTNPYVPLRNLYANYQDLLSKAVTQAMERKALGQQVVPSQQQRPHMAQMSGSNIGNAPSSEQKSEEKKKEEKKGEEKKDEGPEENLELFANAYLALQTARTQYIDKFRDKKEGEDFTDAVEQRLHDKIEYLLHTDEALTKAEDQVKNAQESVRLAQGSAEKAKAEAHLKAMQQNYDKVAQERVQAIQKDIHGLVKDAVHDEMRARLTPRLAARNESTPTDERGLEDNFALEFGKGSVPGMQKSLFEYFNGLKATSAAAIIQKIDPKELKKNLPRDELMPALRKQKYDRKKKKDEFLGELKTQAELQGMAKSTEAAAWARYGHPLKDEKGKPIEAWLYKEVGEDGKVQIKAAFVETPENAAAVVKALIENGSTSITLEGMEDPESIKKAVGTAISMGVTDIKFGEGVKVDDDVKKMIEEAKKAKEDTVKANPLCKYTGAQNTQALIDAGRKDKKDGFKHLQTFLQKCVSSKMHKWGESRRSPNPQDLARCFQDLNNSLKGKSDEERIGYMRDFVAKGLNKDQRKALQTVLKGDDLALFNNLSPDTERKKTVDIKGERKSHQSNSRRM